MKTNTMKFKGFTIARRANGIFNISYKSSDGKIYEGECKNFNEAGEWVWNMADNHNIGREVNHRMCERFEANF